MRIALSNPAVSHAGGVERVVAEAANHLARRDHNVTVYAARADRSVLDRRVRLRPIAVPARLDDRLGLGFRARCGRAIAADAPDVHGAFSTLSPGGGVFWVPSVHRVAYELLLSRRGGVGRLAVAAHPYHRVRLWTERRMFSPGGCDLALAQTEAVRGDLMRCYGHRTQIEVLPLGYDERSFTPIDPQRRARARAAHGYGPGDRVVLFAANELERKGFDVLLEALSRLPDVRLLGVGRVAPDPGALRRAGLEERVMWLGHAADMASVHAVADALVLPTRYEPWGLVVVEALGSGLPVVVSRLAGAAVAVRDGETGVLLHDPEDAGEVAAGIQAALSGRLLDPNAIAASVAPYTWTRILSRYEEALAAVAGSNTL